MRDGGHQRRSARWGVAALGLATGLALGAGPAWALTEADRGAEWLQAPFPQKVRVANILSREFGGPPEGLQRCLDEIFTPNSPNLSLSIRGAAQQCKAKQ